MLIEHKTYGISIEMPEILQGPLEEFEKSLDINATSEGSVQLAVFNGSIVRTAVKVGWLPGIDPDKIAGMKPGLVSFLTNKVVRAVQAAREIPPE